MRKWNWNNPITWKQNFIMGAICIIISTLMELVLFSDVIADWIRRRLSKKQSVK